MKNLFAENLSEKPLISLTLVFMGMFSIMAVWEIIIVKSLIEWGIPSMLAITLVVAGLGAAFISFFPIRALQHSEARFKAIFETVQTGIAIIDLDTHRIVEVNPRLSTLLNTPRDKIIGQDPAEVLCPELLSGQSSRAGNGDVQKSIECRLTTSDRKTVPVIRMATVTDFLGKPYHIQSFADISDLKNAEAALVASEERYKNIVQTQTEFICRFRPDGTHIFVNEAYCRYFNKSCDDFLGHQFKPKIPEEDRPRLRDFFAAITPENPSGTIEHRIIMPDGTIRWQQWSEYGIFDNTGKITEYQSVGRDITRLKEAEASLNRSETLMRSILHGSPNPQFVIGPDHRLLFWTRPMELYTGLKESDVIGTTKQMDVFYPEHRYTLADVLVDGTIDRLPELYGNAIWKSALVNGAYESINFFPKMGGGTWLYFTATPIRDENGELLGAFEIASDITALKQAQDEVKKSHERYLVYIKEAVMRMRTPVEVVRDNLALLSADISSGDADPAQVRVRLSLQVKNLEQIRQNIIDLNQTILEGFGEISESSKQFLSGR